MKKIMFLLVITSTLVAISCTKKSLNDISASNAVTVDASKANADKPKDNFDFAVRIANAHAVPGTPGQVEYFLIDSAYNSGKAIDSITFYDGLVDVNAPHITVPVVNGVAKWTMAPSKPYSNYPYFTSAVGIDKHRRPVTDTLTRSYFVWQ